MGTEMPKYKVVLTRQAKTDIVGIGDYIAYTLLEPGTAGKFVNELREKIAGLKGFPKRYQLVDDVVLSSQGIHCMPYKNYFVFFEVIDTVNTVIVLRVGYNRRNWQKILIKQN